MKKIIIILLLIFAFSSLQNVIASNLQDDIEYIAYNLSPNCPQEVNQSCNYRSGNLRITSYWYVGGDTLIVVLWNGERVAAIDRGEMFCIRNDRVVKNCRGRWIGEVHRIANEK